MTPGLSPQIANQLRTAQAHQQQGDLDDAEQIYREVLARQPDLPDAWRLLGMLASQQGKVNEAIDALHRAIELRDDKATWHFNLANCLRDSGDAPAAERVYRDALDRAPQLLGAQLNLGALLADLDRLEEAQPHYAAALALDPENAAVRGNLAILAQKYNNRGVARSKAGELRAAADDFRQATKMTPDDETFRANLAAVLAQSDCAAEAIEVYRQTVAANPTDDQATLALANLEATEGNFAEAANAFDQAVAQKPDSLLRTLRRQWLALPIFPNTESAQRELISLQQKLVQFDGTNLTLDTKEITRVACKPPGYLLYQQGDLLDVRTAMANLFENQIGAEPPPPNSGKPHLGFVVTPGHEKIFLHGMARLLARIDERRFDITLACHPQAFGLARTKLGPSAVEFLPLSDDFRTTVRDLRSARFDLLYHWEIGTDATNYFLPMFRPARVQCTSWGWPISSGMQAVEYFISSDLLETPDAQQHYREQLVRLPTLPCSMLRPNIPERGPRRAELGITENAVVFLCPQSLYKVHPDMDAHLAEILRQTPQAELLLLEHVYPAVTRMLRERLATTMADVAHRVRFIRRMPRADYLWLLTLADVVLDTWPYSGGANTTYDTFAAGRPLITLPTEYHRGRYATAAYRRIGMTELVASSPEDYVRLATTLAENPAQRQGFGDAIADNCWILFDDVAAAEHLQDFFEQAIAKDRAHG